MTACCCRRPVLGDTASLFAPRGGFKFFSLRRIRAAAAVAFCLRLSALAARFSARATLAAAAVISCCARACATLAAAMRRWASSIFAACCCSSSRRCSSFVGDLIKYIPRKQNAEDEADQCHRPGIQQHSPAIAGKLPADSCPVSNPALSADPGIQPPEADASQYQQQYPHCTSPPHRR